MKWHKLSLILAGAVLAGCAPGVPPSQSAREASATPLPSVTVTKAVMVPTATSISPTPTRENSNALNCFEVLNEMPESMLGHGVVLLDTNGTPGFFLLNLETRERMDLDGPSENFENASVSPNGTMMSIKKITFGDSGKIESDQMLIMETDGTILKSLPWVEGGVSGAAWLDNQYVVIDVSGLDPEQNRGIEPSTLLVLNPFTNERKFLTADFPGLYDGQFLPALPYWGEPWGRSMSVYNQSLSRVVYLSEGGSTYILWDVQHKKEIARFLNFNASYLEPPRWSPDGSKFVVSAYRGNMDSWPQPADGLYLIDTEGNISKLISTGAENDLYIADHFWSPSGRYIAVLVNTSTSGTQQKRLWVLDTQTSQIDDTCVEYQSFIGTDTPIWSPDESQLLLYDNRMDEGGSSLFSKVILVDLVKRVTYEIAKDLEPVGWMKSP